MSPSTLRALRDAPAVRSAWRTSRSPRASGELMALCKGVLPKASRGVDVAPEIFKPLDRFSGGLFV